MTEIMIEALLYAVIGTISVLATTFFTLVLLDWWRARSTDHPVGFLAYNRLRIVTNNEKKPRRKHHGNRSI